MHKIAAGRRFHNEDALYSEKDYQANVIRYSDVFDQVTTPHYDMKVDLREPRQALKVNAKLDLQTLAPVQAISFAISESLPEDESLRKKKGMRVTAARLSDGTSLQTIQGEWEGGFVYSCVGRPTCRRYSIASETGIR